MKYFIIIVSLLVGVFSYSQKTNNNLKNGYMAKGYDVVAYFQNKAVIGNKEFSTKYKEVGYKFATKENLETFKNNPEKFIPQYGGWCAYAIGSNNQKVDINPKTFEIRDQKLYLFYNAWGINTLKKWKEENPEKLKETADKNWEKQ